MITKFKLFETIKVNIDIPEDILNKLINTLSIIAYKGKKRNDKNYKNYKSIRIDIIDGYYNENKLNHNQINNEYLFKIKMNNKDIIESKYTNISNLDGVIENSIYIEINGVPTYHMELDHFNLDFFIEKIGIEYEKYISKKWKIK